MKKTILPIGLNKHQYDYLKQKCNGESMAAYIRKLIENEMFKSKGEGDGR